MSSKKLNLWYNVMKDEMDSMSSNRVWDLVELPNDVKDNVCRWVFKTKKDLQDNIKRHKARLVAMEFTQTRGRRGGGGGGGGGGGEGEESTIQSPFLLYQRKIPFE